MDNLVNNAKETITNALKAYSDQKSSRTYKIDFRDKETLLEIVTVDPNSLFLNPQNPRLKTQLEDHPDEDIVIKNPFSSESQQIVQRLLSNTPKFKKLKEELENLGQQEPGVITRDGLLINGNTRVAALRSLSAEGVDVAVLPIDANDQDYLNLEMSLQMMKLTHQDFTFTNELKLIKKYLAAGHDMERLAKKMAWTRNKKKKFSESLQLIELVQEIRDINPENPIPYEIIDEKKEHLKNLNESYQALLVDDDNEAERLKWGRITAMLLGINKDRTREIDSEFFEDEVMPRLRGSREGSELIERFTKVATPSDGLDDILETPEELLDLKELTRHISREISGTDLPLELEQIYESINDASIDQIYKKNKKTKLSEPTELLSQIKNQLDELVDKFGDALLDKSFDRKRFKFSLEKVTKSVARLNKDIEKLV